MNSQLPKPKIHFQRVLILGVFLGLLIVTIFLVLAQKNTLKKNHWYKTEISAFCDTDEQFENLDEMFSTFTKCLRREFPQAGDIRIVFDGGWQAFININSKDAYRLNLVLNRETERYLEEEKYCKSSKDCILTLEKTTKKEKDYSIKNIYWENVSHDELSKSSKYTYNLKRKKSAKPQDAYCKQNLCTIRFEEK